MYVCMYICVHAYMQYLGSQIIVLHGLHNGVPHTGPAFILAHSMENLHTGTVRIVCMCVCMYVRHICSVRIVRLCVCVLVCAYVCILHFGSRHGGPPYWHCVYIYMCVCVYV
jgi:hypothetical protein